MKRYIKSGRYIGDYYLSDAELEEWLNELKTIINDETISPKDRIQKIVDEITAS